jgi:hypothetical protein
MKKLFIVFLFIICLSINTLAYDFELKANLTFNDFDDTLLTKGGTGTTTWETTATDCYSGDCLRYSNAGQRNWAYIQNDTFNLDWCENPVQVKMWQRGVGSSSQLGGHMNINSSNNDWDGLVMRTISGDTDRQYHFDSGTQLEEITDVDFVNTQTWFFAVYTLLGYNMNVSYYNSAGTFLHTATPSATIDRCAGYVGWQSYRSFMWDDMQIFTTGEDEDPPAAPAGSFTPSFQLSSNITAGNYEDNPFNITFNGTINYDYSGFTDSGDLLLYHKFDTNQSNTSIDSTINGNNGTINTAVYINSGHTGGAYLFGFDNTIDSIRLPASNTLIPDTNDFAIMAWFYPTSINDTENNNRIINIHRSATAASGVNFGLGENQITFRYWDGSTLEKIQVGTISSEVWSHAAMVYDGTNYTFFLNGNLTNTTTDTLGAMGSYDAFIGAFDESGTNSFFRGVIDEVRIYNNSLTPGQVSAIYNSTYPLFECTLYANDTAVASKQELNISEINTIGWDTTAIDAGYNLNVTCTDQFLTASDQESGVFIDTIYSDLINVTFNNFYDTEGVSYTRNLTYTAYYSCNNASTTKLHRIVNGMLNYTHNVSCSDAATIMQSGSYQHPTETPFNITFDFNTTLNSYSESSSLYNFTSDLINPNIALLAFNFSSDFVLPAANVSLICNDSIYPTLLYNLTLNNENLYFNNKTNYSLQTNNTLNLANGVNTITGVCSDPFGSASDTLQQNLELRNLFIIDEQLNTGYDISNASVIVYLDDNRTSYDFTTNGKNNITFVSTADVKLRFQIQYDDGTIILRYVDIGLLEDDVRVCANTEGITHFEQILTSSSIRPAILKSVFSDCIVAADYTRFAYQDAKILKAYTYNNLYYLYTFENNDISQDQIFLASVDGSIATYINIDIIEFQAEGYNINTVGDTLAVNKRNANEMNIYYYNVMQDNTALRIAIERLDTEETLFNSTSFADADEAQILFNFATLTPAVNDTTLFRVTATATDADGDKTTIKYFNTSGVTGFINSALIAIVSIFLIVFGLSMTATQRTFAYFGAFIVLINIGILSFATGVWYITFLQAINAIILIFIILVTMGKNQVQIG